MIGILLINLGTPEAPTESAVRDYLDVFLSDPYVITLPKLLRDFLVQKIILPKRPKLSAHAYQQIWTEAGSPLLVNSMLLQEALQHALGDHYAVALGMRYSKPSVETALIALEKKSCEKIIVLPLFPQLANATTQSALDVVNSVIQSQKITAKIEIIRDFHHQDFYIDSLAKIIQNALNQNKTEFLLLSYHGLPKRQRDSAQYQKQCYDTSHLLAQKLNLSPEHYQICFQSRLGFTKWISPYTDQAIKTLRKKGIKRLSIACPSFVADCIETLEEINIRLREEWMQLGGESFHMIPCLNADRDWSVALANFLHRT